MSVRKAGYRQAAAALIAVVVIWCVGCVVVAQTAPPRAARSVILMIGDGMGVGQIEAARWTLVGSDDRAETDSFDFAGCLNMDALEVQDGWSRTDDVWGRTTDSAAAATAMATGHKTRNGWLSVDLEGALLPTILEMAQAAGKAVGVVTSVPLTHATPAAFVAHDRDRNRFMAIAEDMCAAGVDVLLGGGAHHFLPHRRTCDCGGSGARADERDLVAEAQAAGYTFACNAKQLESVDTSSVGRLLGLFAEEEMPRPLRPSLAQMTRTAIEVLSRDPDGFFLVVEGGLIDWVCHDNHAAASIELALGFDEAVGVALDYVREAGETLLIVTADHETGGMQVYAEERDTFREDGPFPTPSGSGFYVDWLHTSHTDAEVPVRAEGPCAARLSGTYENTYIFHVMAEAFGLPVSKRATPESE